MYIAIAIFTSFYKYVYQKSTNFLFQSILVLKRERRAWIQRKLNRQIEKEERGLELKIPKDIVSLLFRHMSFPSSDP